ncbi:MAG TPA: twin-arginine translocation signal domain-containing protein [Sedimentisphaerales bacterium]|nr:twin-arginine translocation signal domain-containing protein [Sedimentisphaerales bacterium]HRS12011.1 twin-arginine translocation signal domain-containing protein [Sedimentisphaerales bacterium]HRV49067.1 twin-arginine translocation signal domain-containing protein [Sedimentisphaerales bacterium]
MSVPSVPSTSRRDFLKQTSGALAGAALAGAIGVRAWAGEQNTIQVALVGCGGRGTGAAANALSTKGPTRLVAMADAFDSRLKSSLANLSTQFGEKVDVPADRQFVGLDGYKKAIDTIAPGGVVLLATPPAFRPIHVEYAVAKGCHIFMEKSFAVDAPGIRRVLKAGEEAERKNLKVAGGLMSRHYKPLKEAVEQLHKGLIGNLITCWAYREHAPVGFTPKSPGMTEMAHQIRNYSNFTWLNGSFLLDWLIHNLDVCCWCKDAWPVSAQGHGGRQARTAPDQLFDHYAVEYHFPDGTRLFAQGRHMDNCWGFFGDIIHGTTGSAVLGEGITQPRIFKGHRQRAEDIIWEYEGGRWDHYQYEHDLLFDAIRTNKRYNETTRCCNAAMVGILGRMAAESGQMITWEQAMASDLQLAPGLDNYTMDSTPPVVPDAQGRYPVAIPGQTTVL